LIGRARRRGAERGPWLGRAHAWLCEIARRLEPLPDPVTGEPPTGQQVREQVEAYLAEIAAALDDVTLPDWLRPPVEHLRTVLLRLGAGLYHCYDVPGLPRTNNDLEQFYRHIKATERRITGHRRSDSFVVRVGGFAVDAILAGHEAEEALLCRLATVAARDWREERATLRANQERQTQMRRFHLHPEAYLADLEARWSQLAETGPP
jgi:hypothetical protein